MSIVCPILVPFFVLGGGSNIVVPDEGVTYPIISTGGLKSLTYDRQLQCVTCQAGVTIKELIDFCLAKGLGGVENFAGLPGTIGGAVFMNARCYDVSISHVLISACYVDIDNPHNEIQQYVKQHTAPYKYPRIVEFRDELPKTISGKIQRNKL